jgi:hypothetical protein
MHHKHLHKPSSATTQKPSTGSPHTTPHCTALYCTAAQFSPLSEATTRTPHNHPGCQAASEASCQSTDPIPALPKAPSQGPATLHSSTASRAHPALQRAGLAHPSTAVWQWDLQVLPKQTATRWAPHHHLISGQGGCSCRSPHLCVVSTCPKVQKQAANCMNETTAKDAAHHSLTTDSSMCKGTAVLNDGQGAHAARSATLPPPPPPYRSRAGPPNHLQYPLRTAATCSSNTQLSWHNLASSAGGAPCPPEALFQTCPPIPIGMRLLPLLKAGEMCPADVACWMDQSIASARVCRPATSIAAEPNPALA